VRRCRQAAPADGESSGWHVSYLPVVRCARVGLLPSRSGRIAMYAAAINRPSPTTPSPRVPIASALTGWSPASWAAACKRGRDAGHPRQAAKGRHHRRCRSATGIQFDPQASLPPTGDRDRPRRPTQREGAKGSYEVQGACGVLLAVCPVLGNGPGGFAGPLDDRAFAPSRPRQCQGQAGDRG
jgi:hypothetical protein